MTSQLSLEQEIKQYFQNQRISFQDNCESLKKLDYGFGDILKGRFFQFDVKEKRKAYNLNNWTAFTAPEEFAFILDDLAARKILASAPLSGMVVRDYKSRYHFFSILDLYLMPKIRVNRPINRNEPMLKGKWLIDLRNGNQCKNVSDVFKAIDNYLNNINDLLFENPLECYGNYIGENIKRQGIIRSEGYWDEDWKATR